MMRYIGVDISSNSATIAILEGEQTKAAIHTLQKPAHLKHYLNPETAIAAEWTGALAAQWLDEALLHTEHVYIYRTQGIRADKRAVGSHQKTDENDATALARLLKIQSELGSPRFYRYSDLQEAYRVRRIVYEAERYTREIARAKTLLQNARMTGYEIPEENGYLKTLESIEKQAWKRAEEAIMKSKSVSPIYQVIKKLYPYSNHTACKIAVSIAPIERWSSAAALRRYAGLYDQRGYTGKMILRSKGKQGNKTLRTALIQLATPAKYPKNRWNPLYQKMKARGLKGLQISFRIASYMLNEIYQNAKGEQKHGYECYHCGQVMAQNEAIPLITGEYSCLNCMREVSLEDYYEWIKETWDEETQNYDNTEY